MTGAMKGDIRRPVLGMKVCNEGLYQRRSPGSEEIRTVEQTRGSVTGLTSHGKDTGAVEKAKMMGWVW